MWFGGALLQMWQTEIGAGSFADALVYAAAGGLVLLIVSKPDA